MPIDFRCTHCQKLLRTPDDTAGKQAKCPECGTILIIPAPGTAPPPPTSPGVGPAAGGAAGSPFAAGSAGAGASPFGRPGDPANPYQSPGEHTYAPGPSTMAAPGMGMPSTLRPTLISMNDIFSRTWTIFKEKWGQCLVAVLILLGMNMGANLLLQGVHGAATQMDEAPRVILLGVVQVAVSVFSFWLSIGQAIYFLKVARGQPAVFGDLFSGGPYFLSALGATILFGLAAFAGLLLCVVPGIIVGLMFSQYLFLIVDGRAGAIESLSKSKELMVGNKLTLLATGILAAIVGILVIIGTLFVGYFAVVPYMCIMMAVVYLAVSGQPTADQLRYGAMPAPPQA